MVVKAGTVAIAVKATGKGSKRALANIPVVLATGGYFINFQQLYRYAGRGGDFSGIELVVRVKGAFNLLQHRVQIGKEIGRVFGAQSFTVFTPEYAAVSPGERGDLITDQPDQFFLCRVFHIDGWTYMQHSGVHMAVHAIRQFMFIKQCAKLMDKFCQMLRRYRRILDKRNGSRFTGHITQQANRLFTHMPDFFHIGTALNHPKA